MPRLLLVFFICLLTSCHSKPTPIQITSDTAAVPFDDQTLYFPDTTFFIGKREKLWLQASNNSRYSSLLFLLREPILYKDRRSAESYRFLCYPARSGVISVRLEKNYDRITLYTKEAGSNGLAVDTRKLLTEKEWQEWLLLLKKADFWNLPTTDQRTGDDGCQYLLEGKSPDKYHVVDRWLPGTGPYNDCCTYLLTLSGLTH